MKGLLLALSLVLALVQQPLVQSNTLTLPALPASPSMFQAPEPEAYPGQREHREPPEGFKCEHQKPDFSVPVLRLCDCHRGCMAMNDDGTMRATTVDPQCTTFCHETNHCACPMPACDS